MFAEILLFIAIQVLSWLFFFDKFDSFFKSIDSFLGNFKWNSRKISQRYWTNTRQIPYIIIQRQLQVTHIAKISTISL